MVTSIYWHDIAKCLKSFLNHLSCCEMQSRPQLKQKQHLRDKYCLLISYAGETGYRAIQCLNHIGMITRLLVIRFNRDGAGQKCADYIETNSK